MKVKVKIGREPVPVALTCNLISSVVKGFASRVSFCNSTTFSGVFAFSLSLDLNEKLKSPDGGVNGFGVAAVVGWDNGAGATAGDKGESA